MPVAAVIFDLFDTLVDLHMDRLPRVVVDDEVLPSTYVMLHEALGEFEPIPFADFVRQLREVDRAQNRLRHVEHVEVPTLERFARLCAALSLQDPRIPERLTRVHMDALQATAEYLAHHPEVLGKLRDRVRLGVCSNFSHSPTAHAVLERAGLSDCFHATVISDAVGHRKPRREIFEHVLGELGVRPEQALHVGDNLSADIVGAAAVGVRTVWITRRVADPERVLAAHSGPGPDFVIADLGELPALLERVQAGA